MKGNVSGDGCLLHFLSDDLVTKNRPLIYKVTADRLPDFWKERLNKERIKGKTSKMLEVVLEEKRREIIKEWIKEGNIKDISNKI